MFSGMHTPLSFEGMRGVGTADVLAAKARRKKRRRMELIIMKVIQKITRKLRCLKTKGLSKRKYGEVGG